MEVSKSSISHLKAVWVAQLKQFPLRKSVQITDINSCALIYVVQIIVH